MGTVCQGLGQSKVLPEDGFSSSHVSEVISKVPDTGQNMGNTDLLDVFGYQLSYFSNFDLRKGTFEVGGAHCHCQQLGSPQLA